METKFIPNDIGGNDIAVMAPGGNFLIKKNNDNSAWLVFQETKPNTLYFKGSCKTIDQAMEYIAGVKC